MIRQQIEEAINFTTPLALEKSASPSPFPEISIMNERGSTTLLNVFILMMITSWGVILIGQRLNKRHDLKEKIHITLCSKELNGVLKAYITKIEDDNKLLAMLTKGQAIGMFIPIIGTITAQTSLSYALKAVKAHQYLEKIKYHYFLFQHVKKGCLSYFFQQYRPYTWKRDYLNRVMAKRDHQTYTIKGKKWIIRTRLQVSNQKFFSQMKKVSFF